MTDHERELLKWMADQLLGWRFVGGYWYPPTTEDHGFSPLAFQAHFESWYGIGLAVEAMDKRGMWCQIKSPFELGSDWWAGFTPHGTTGWNGKPDFRGNNQKPWFAVYEAARKAVTA